VQHYQFSRCTKKSFLIGGKVLSTSKIIKNFARNKKDTGSSEIQIALSSHHISNLALHLNNFKNDHQAKRGLVRHVNRRKKLMKYYYSVNPSEAKDLVKQLNLKKI
jgi:small subunit ribosomal protein S15